MAKINENDVWTAAYSIMYVIKVIQGHTNLGSVDEFARSHADNIIKTVRAKSAGELEGFNEP